MGSRSLSHCRPPGHCPPRPRHRPVVVVTIVSTLGRVVVVGSSSSPSSPSPSLSSSCCHGNGHWRHVVIVLSTLGRVVVVGSSSSPSSPLPSHHRPTRCCRHVAVALAIGITSLSSSCRRWAGWWCHHHACVHSCCGKGGGRWCW